MKFQNPHDRSSAVRRLLVAAVLAGSVLTAAACSSPDSPVSSPASASSPIASPSASAQPGQADARELLAQAREAAKTMKNYEFKLRMTQKLKTGTAANDSDVSVDMEGRAELGPLKLDQQVSSVTDGQAYSIRAILVPDAYYMYDPEFEEWSKTPKEQTAEIAKTLSDFQVDPGKALAAVAALGGGLKSEEAADGDKIAFSGNGSEAKAFLDTVLESTLDLSGMDPKIRDSIKLSSLNVDVELDPASHLPTSYRIDSVMTVEYEAGKPSTLTQSFSGSYAKINAAAPVTVPEAAKEAPELDPSELDTGSAQFD
ncbi:DUF6612 family protein [Cohnella caldifontis]|uniref:DUF6612 family protein n=1 Tax=Cohnella caldifontis TaxID=3027471 RepID=UPI0023EC3D96|nr:DUF6612 family protein [Cohnella sp. YIM B05605]